MFRTVDGGRTSDKCSTPTRGPARALSSSTRRTPDDLRRSLRASHRPVGERRFSGGGTGLYDPSTPERRRSDSLSRRPPEAGVLSHRYRAESSEAHLRDVQRRGEAAGSIDPMTAETWTRTRPIPAWAGTCGFTAVPTSYSSPPSPRIDPTMKKNLHVHRGRARRGGSQRVSINPEKPDIMLTADRGATRSR